MGKQIVKVCPSCDEKTGDLPRGSAAYCLPCTRLYDRARYATSAARRSALRASGKAREGSPLGRFETQRKDAKRRGIVWDFTFEQWLAWWGEDYVRRGQGPDALCMARVGDVGPYSISNVYKSTNSDNGRLGALRQNHTEIPESWASK